MISLALLSTAALISAAQDYGTYAPPRQTMTQPPQQTETQGKKKESLAPIAAPVVPPGRALKDLPNVTIAYADVAGKNAGAIQRSLAKMKDANGQSKAADVKWNIGADFTQRTENGKCSIAGATAKFKATAVLPRLADEQGVDAATLNTWKAYVATVEAYAASDLWFVHDRLPDIENAIKASTCEGADAAGSAALQRLKQQEAEFRKQYFAKK